MIGSVSANETITNTTNGGLKTAIDKVNNGQTVYMENGVYSGNNNTGITIDRSITIEGKGNNVVIDAKGTNRIFTIENGNTVTLKNLKFINGKSAGDGGAIYNSGSTLSISGCTFNNNIAEGHIDRVLYYFSNGIPSLNPSYGKRIGYNGGAIHNYGGTLSINGCTFINNQAYGCGGAIYNSEGTLSISGSTFTNNQAENKLENDDSVGSGGAIYSSGGVPTISGCTFTNNRAKNDGGAFYGSAPKNKNIDVINSNFINNYAGGYGGAISTSSYYGSIGKIIVNACTFTNNRAGFAGGAIAGGDYIVSNSNFIDNQAKEIGGAIMTYYDDITLNNVIFKNNIAKGVYNAVGGYSGGGKVYSTKVTITPTDGTKVGASTSNTGVTTASKLADLKITKVTKKGNIRHVFIKNVGKVAAGKNTLGVYIGKTLIKKVTVKSIGVGKTLKVKVAIPKKFMAKKYINKFKIFKVDIRNVVKESNKKNNSFKVK